jgi:hypothetical protein
MNYFLWLASHSLEGPIYAWRFTLILLLLIAIAGGRSFLYERVRFQKDYLLLLSPFLVTLLVLVWGTIMAHPRMHRPEWSYYVLYLLSLLHLPLAVLLIYRMRDVRWFAASVLAFELWIGFCCVAMVLLSGVSSN